MTAFVSFIRVYGIWIYLLCALGILFGFKMLADARRLARTTLFSLEQERAREQSYRAVILIFVAVIAIGTVSTVAVIGPALVPTQESPILRGATPTLPAFVFPTNTPVPTPTRTPPPPTETPFVTTIPITATATRIVKPTVPIAPSATPTPPMPAPVLTGPLPNGGTWVGEGQAGAAMTFRWNCDQCILGPNDWYEVVITYIDKSGMPKTVAGRTQDKFLSLRRLIDGGQYDIYQKAKEGLYQWFVQVKHEPGNQPLTPPSEVWKFTWL